MDFKKTAEELADKFANPTDGVLWPVQKTELREVVQVALSAAYQQGVEEERGRCEKAIRDHYYDSFEKDRDLIISHVLAALRQSGGEGK